MWMWLLISEQLHIKMQKSLARSLALPFLSHTHTHTHTCMHAQVG